jgi:hypothetical protein
VALRTECSIPPYVLVSGEFTKVNGGAAVLIDANEFVLNRGQMTLRCLLHCGTAHLVVQGDGGTRMICYKL